jgi:hypothetical protein
MELLKASNKHLQKIKDKRAIFFWGKTGAGKSSVIGYFLGAPLDIYINHVGDKVVDIKKGRVDDGRYPKIGQSLAESETLYAQGYPLPSDNHGMSEEILLADCPGFDDTRGADFELCTNLSIDRAVQECKEVNAIVIIVPVQAFLLDRGNSMLDLVDTIQERFPKTFNPDKPQHSARLFFLITKDVQAQPESVAKLRDGTRIRAILEEATKKLQELVNRAQEGIDVEFELSTVQRKLKIWQSILQMHTNGQVDVVNLTNQKERIRLLKKYSHTSDQSAPGRIGKKDYTPVMHGERMRMKFGKYIEMSTHTWIYRIFDQYLHKIPEAIFSIEKKISAKNQSIQEVKEEIDARTQKIIQLELTQEKVKELLKELEKAQTNSDALSKEQRSELQKRVDATTNAAVIDAEKEIQSLTHDSTRKTDRLNLTIQEIEKLNKKMSENELNLKSLRARVDELSTGNQLVELEHVHYSPNQPLNLIQLSHDVRQRRFDEMNPDIADSDILKSYSENTSTYCGKLAEDLFIEKRFKLVPIDPSLRAQFNNVHKVATTFANGKVGQYEAKVEGKKFEIALGFKASADGKKIVYSFNTIFDGKDLPEIKISHTIPNMDYNEATIIGLNSQISALEKEISGLGVELKGAGPVLGKEKEKDGIEKEIQDLETVINHKKAQVERLKKGMAADKLEEMIREKKAELNVIVEDLTKLKSFKELEDKLKSLQDEMQWEEERLKETQKTKRNLALIIYQQQEIAKLLREFSELATSTEGKEQFGEKRRNEMIESCHQYIKLFDAHFTKLLDECERTLNFRKHHEL